MNVKIYHNPRCSKSRQTLQLLQAQGLAPRVVEYLKTPPDAATLADVLDLLGLEPRQLMRRNEAVYDELNLDNPELGREALIQSMIDHPILMQRPIVVRDGKLAAIGRPPESVLEIIK